MTPRIPILTLVAALAALTQVAAQARTSPAEVGLIEHNAAQERTLAADIAHGRLDLLHAARLDGRQAALYRKEAAWFEAGADLHALAPTRRLQRRVWTQDAAAAHAHASRASERLGLMHDRVEALRDAEQQRAIARGLSAGRLAPQQVAQLEGGQARLAEMQQHLSAARHETVDQALHVSHLEDVQDWQIASGSIVL